MPPKIDRNIMIGELVMNYPAAVEVLFEYGFHCIGCGLSAYETLGQGCAAHGFDESTVDEVIAKIKKATEAEREKKEEKLKKERLAEIQRTASSVSANAADLRMEKGKKG